MALDFPNIPPPTEGQLYVGANGITYVFSGGKWVGQGASGSNVTTTTDSLFNANFVVDLDATGNLNIPAGGDVVRNGLSIFDAVESLQANSSGADVAAANVQIGLLWTNAAAQATALNTLNANLAAANLSVAALSANIGNLVNNAPAALDTLYEIANSLDNNASLSTTLMTAISGVRANVNAANLEIASTNANLAAFSAYANLTFTGGGGSTYSNANVAAYLITNPPSGTYSNTNVAAYLVANPQGSTYSNANVAAYLVANPQGSTYSNVNVQAYLGANVGAYQTWANTTFSTVSNAATQQTQINSINANVAAANTAIGAVTTAWSANAATQQTQINSINANVTAANAAIASIWVANAGVQQTQINSINANITAANTAIATLQTQVYSNVNTAAYLAGAVTTGNLTAGNLTVSKDAVVLGNLRVQGTQTTVNAATLTVNDLYVTVANGAVQASDANGAGLRIAGALANIAYSSTSDSFEFNKAITVGNVNFANGVNILSTVTVANLTFGANVVSLGINGNLTLPNNMIFTSSPAISGTGIIFGDGSYQYEAYQGPGPVLVNGTHNAALDPFGNLTVPGSILPNTDNVFDLGSSDMRFRHLYVGPGTVYVGNAAIKTTVSGNLILPGVTRAVASSAFVEQVEITGDQSYSFTTNPTIIDNARFEQLSGGQVSSFTPATYSSTGIDNAGYIRNIEVDTAGSGYANGVAALAEQNMWATETANPLNNFNINNWIQIPFRVRSRAGESEFVFSTGVDTGDITFDNNEIGSSGDFVNIVGDEYAQLESNGNYVWVDNSGAHIQVSTGGGGNDAFDFEHVGGITRLKLPPDGDIVDSTGTSVLGGGSGNVDLGKFKIVTDSGAAILTTTDDADGYGGYDISITPSEMGSAFIRVPNNANAELGQSLTINSLEANSSVQINTDWSDPWIFGSDGTLTLPGAITVDATYNSLVAEFDGGAGEYYLIILKEDWPTANVEIQVGDIISKATDPSTSLVVTGAVIDSGIFWNAPTGNNYIAGGTMSFNLSRPKPEWQFNANSTIILPPGGDILDSNGASVLGGGNVDLGNFEFSDDTITNGNGLILNTSRGTLAIGTNMEAPGSAQHFHIAFDGSNSEPNANDLFLGDDYNYVKLPGYELNPADHGVEIGANDRDGGDQHVWRFGTDGILTFPSGMTISDAGGGQGIYGSDNAPVGVGAQGSEGLASLQWVDNISSPTQTAGVIANSPFADPGSVQIVTGAFDVETASIEHSWTFGANGSIAFPDATVQTTAWTGRIVAQENLMLDGGGAATIYEVTVDYAEGGFSSTRYGVNTPSFNGGGADLEEAIYYTLDGGGA